MPSAGLGSMSPEKVAASVPNLDPSWKEHVIADKVHTFVAKNKLFDKFPRREAHVIMLACLAHSSWHTMALCIQKFPDIPLEGPAYLVSPSVFRDMLERAHPVVVRAYLANTALERESLHRDTAGENAYLSALRNKEPKSVCRILYSLMACRYGSASLLQWLHEHGMSSTAINRYGETPFHCFCHHNRSERGLIYLHSVGLTSTGKNKKNGDAPFHKALHLASDSQDCNAHPVSLFFVQLLHRYGLMSEELDGIGRHPLYLSHTANNIPVTRYLYTELGYRHHSVTQKDIDALEPTFVPFRHYPCLFTHDLYHLVRPLDEESTRTLLLDLYTLTGRLDGGDKIAIAASCDGDELGPQEGSLRLLKFAVCLGGQDPFDGSLPTPRFDSEGTMTCRYMVEFPVVLAEVKGALRSVFNHSKLTLCLFGMDSTITTLMVEDIVGTVPICEVIDGQILPRVNDNCIRNARGHQLSLSLSQRAKEAGYLPELGCPSFANAATLTASANGLVMLAGTLFPGAGFAQLQQTHDFYLRAASDVALTASSVAILHREGLLSNVVNITKGHLVELWLGTECKGLSEDVDEPLVLYSVTKQILFNLKPEDAHRVMLLAGKIAEGDPLSCQNFPARFDLDQCAIIVETQVLSIMSIVAGAKHIHTLDFALPSVLKLLHSLEDYRSIELWPNLHDPYETVHGYSETLKRDHRAELLDVYAKLLTAASSALGKSVLAESTAVATAIDLHIAKHPDQSKACDLSRLARLYFSDHKTMPQVAGNRFQTLFNSVPQYWDPSLSGTVKRDATPAELVMLDKAFQECGGKGKVHAAQHITNMKLYRLYATRRKMVAAAPGPINSTFPLNTRNVSLASYAELSPAANEALFFHGTRNMDTAEIIMDQGFDPRLGRGYFGHGAYFADDPRKASKYSHVIDSEGRKGLLVSRVCLGRNPFQTSTADKKLERPPAVEGVPGTCVIASEFKKYREYIVYQRVLAYPEWIIWVQWK
ncbi:hypothetical protein KIPB_002387 [Kipferlia bialata]|uniref:Poly [ADP-ribose] polymerase n=1 Tax=Kipferlia bialata TaxID=797122 RepID=A0A9K3CSN7_9EUKA|nr:hypothetical protein KIPB_002387 [Kipferlia bialata]|eukprot:g2387.t1